MALQWLTGGSANAITSALLNPLDVLKTQLQAKSRANNDSSGGNRRMMSTMLSLIQRKGIISGLFLPGLRESMAREMLNSGARAGFYVPIRNFVQDEWGKKSPGETRSSSTFFTKAFAAIISGALGAIIANPVDVLKIRMMTAASNEEIRPQGQRSLIGALYDLYKERGLMNGLMPSTMRGTCISVGEIATYDQSKATLRALNIIHEEGPLLHIVASLITGLVATTVAAPFDLLKTRAMNASTNAMRTQMGFSSIVKNEGVMTLFRGWLPAYLRLGPHALICFPLFEKFRQICNLPSI